MGVPEVEGGGEVTTVIGIIVGMGEGVGEGRTSLVMVMEVLGEGRGEQEVFLAMGVEGEVCLGEEEAEESCEGGVGEGVGGILATVVAVVVWSGMITDGQEVGEEGGDGVEVESGVGEGVEGRVTICTVALPSPGCTSASTCWGGRRSSGVEAPESSPTSPTCSTVV